MEPGIKLSIHTTLHHKHIKWKIRPFQHFKANKADEYSEKNTIDEIKLPQHLPN